MPPRATIEPWVPVAQAPAKVWPLPAPLVHNERPCSSSLSETSSTSAPASTSISLAASMPGRTRSEEHTSELQSLMRISYAVFCLKKKNTTHTSYIQYTH